MASGIVAKGTKLGAVQKNKTFPYTAPSDGVIYYDFAVNNSSITAYLYIMEETNNQYLAMHQTTAGMAIHGSTVVKKGWKLKVDYISNATFSTLWFIPFE